MSRARHWHATASGEQVITLTFTVSYEAEANCYYDKGQVSGAVESSYEPEGECNDLEYQKFVITDEYGAEFDADSDVGKLVMAEFKESKVEDELMSTTPDDYREDRRDYYKDVDF